MAEATGFMGVDNFVGTYLRGTTYVGSASAAQSKGIFGAPIGAPMNFSTTSAVAALAIDSAGAMLTVASPADHQRLMFQQQSASHVTTAVSEIYPDNSFPGGPSQASCSGCLPDLFAGSLSLAWTGAVAHFAGTIRADGSVDEQAFDVTSSASLTLQSPCELTWDQIAVLNGGALGYTQIGNEMIAHGNGSIQTVAPSFRMCDGQAVPYTIDSYVELTNLFHYGVRNYTAGTPVSVCGGA
jgi:hypothetical protein